jgi:ABC-type methionine transport system ATPase subunit
MTAAQTPTEKKYRIHFPLDRISAPVMTHLVTDYDLSPNLLRADIDAKNGGWLVVGLTGDAARIDAALAWLRGQGLGVAEEV